MTIFEMKINKIYSYNIDYKYNRSCLMTLYYTYIVYVYMYSLIMYAVNQDITYKYLDHIH